LPGRPDLVTGKYGVAIFVHGCFWHAHDGCRFFKIPEGNRDFWVEKLERNRVRDALCVEKVRAAGWRVAVVWECATRTAPAATIDSVYEFLVGDEDFLQIAAPLAKVR